MVRVAGLYCGETQTINGTISVSLALSEALRAASGLYCGEGLCRWLTLTVTGTLKTRRADSECTPQIFA